METGWKTRGRRVMLESAASWISALCEQYWVITQSLSRPYSESLPLPSSFTLSFSYYHHSSSLHTVFQTSHQPLSRPHGLSLSLFFSLMPLSTCWHSQSPQRLISYTHSSTHTTHTHRKNCRFLHLIASVWAVSAHVCVSRITELLLGQHKSLAMGTSLHTTLQL